MIARDLDLGRRRGVYVPAAELQILELQGWRLVDDLAGASRAVDDDGDPIVLMQPPQIFQGAA